MMARFVSVQPEEILARMTQQEKIAQLCGAWIRPFQCSMNSPLSLYDINRKFSPEKARVNIPDGIGWISNTASSDNLSPVELVAFIRDLQTWLVHETRMGIPAILLDEGITGFTALGVTTFPQVIGMSATWNPEQVAANTDFTRNLMREIGAHQIFSPMSDICRDGTWERLEEGYGEEPYLTTVMVTAFVKTLQQGGANERVSATIKHFAGYGVGSPGDPRLVDRVEQGLGGTQAAPPTLPSFFDDILRPFDAEIQLGGALSAMTSYGNFYGQPCTGSRPLVDGILRKKLGFDGVLVSDFGAVHQLNEKDPGQSAADALNAGVDVCLPDGNSFRQGIPDALKRGLITQETVDQAVLRVLRHKARLGLLGADAKLFATTVPEFDPPAARRLAYDSACQSLVLLKNEGGILPVSREIKSIAVVGPNAAAAGALLGDYTYQNLSTFWHNQPFRPDRPKLVTLLDGLRNAFEPSVKLVHARGCSWDLPLWAPEADEAVAAAKSSDLVIAAMGDNRYTTGEGSAKGQQSVFRGDQEEFIRRLAATGKPIILIDFGGRPRLLGNVAPLCKAVVMAWFPGEEGGNAVADMLKGTVNPSGKLTVTLPKSAKQVPTWHTQQEKPYDPLYPFGHGLSYTSYRYDGFSAVPSLSTTDEGFEVSFTLQNIGPHDGVEIAQLYAAPGKMAGTGNLIGFARVALKAGQSRAVTIKVPLQLLAKYDENLSFVLTPVETCRLSVAASSTDVRLSGILSINGQPRVFPKRNVFFSETKI